MKKQTFTPDEDFTVEMTEFAQWLEQSKSSTQHMNTTENLIDKLQIEIESLKDEVGCYETTYDKLQGEIKALAEANRELATQVLKLKAELYNLLR